MPRELADAPWTSNMSLSIPSRRGVPGVPSEPVASDRAEHQDRPYQGPTSGEGVMGGSKPFTSKPSARLRAPTPRRPSPGSRRPRGRSRRRRQKRRAPWAMIGGTRARPHYARSKVRSGRLPRERAQWMEEGPTGCRRRPCRRRKPFAGADRPSAGTIAVKVFSSDADARADAADTKHSNRSAGMLLPSHQSQPPPLRSSPRLVAARRIWEHNPRLPGRRRQPRVDVLSGSPPSRRGCAGLAAAASRAAMSDASRDQSRDA